MPISLSRDSETIEVKDSDLGVPGGDPETVYVLRLIPQKVAKEIRKRHTREALGRRPEVFDQQGFGEALVDYCLVDWRGVLVEGQPAPCTREHKLMLDSLRQGLLIERAGMSQVVEADADRAESFR